jgi:hypothetical protein
MISRRVLSESVVLGVAVLVLLSSSVGTVAATVPVIDSVQNISVPPNAIIRVKITHQGNYGQNIGVNHMIDMIEVDFKGAVKSYPVTLDQQFSMTMHAPIDPFTADLTIGTLASNEAPVVKVRAHCNSDGWSVWSGAVPIPEFNFSAVAAIIIVAVTASLLVTRIARAKPVVSRYV